MARRVFIRILPPIAVAVLLLGLSLPSFSQAAPSITNVLYVNDSGDYSPCAVGVRTLRCAIEFANGDINPTTIYFSVYFVTLAGALPAINHADTVIDGTTLHALIDGSNLPFCYFSCFGNYDIFTIAADNVMLTNLQIVNGSNRGNAISISSGTNIAIAYNDIGIHAGASTCPGLSGGVDGIYVARNAAGTSQVNVAYIYGNTLSCNGGAGVDIRDATVSVGFDRNGATVGNFIGTTDNGQKAAGNGTQGVYVSKSFSTWVTDTIANNTLSGNSQYGIYLPGNHTDNTTICDNIIGLNYYTASVPYAVPNGLGGVLISGADNTRFGSCQVLAANQPANHEPSVLVLGRIGNIIAGNHGPGIDLRGAGNTTLDGDAIGGDERLLLLGYRQGCIGNTQQGILLEGSTNGSTLYPAAVACNGGAGIATSGLAISNVNTVVPDFVAYNNGLPIDRADDGRTPINYPAIELVNTSTISPVISGSACSFCLVEVYAAIGNPGIKGGGGLRIGGSIGALNGTWVVTASPSITRFVPSLTLASFSAYEIDSSGSLYEMRPRPQVFLPLSLKSY